MVCIAAVVAAVYSKKSIFIYRKLDHGLVLMEVALFTVYSQQMDIYL